MENQNQLKVSKFYFLVVLLLMLVFPLLSIWIDNNFKFSFSTALTGKWFIFWAIGMRLFTAGLRQVIKPGLTAKGIFHIDSIESHAIVRELGFMNICLGLLGLMSLFISGWREAAAFTGGLYMGIAGIQHIIKKPAGANEMVAMVSDMFIFLVMGWYLICGICC